MKILSVLTSCVCVREAAICSLALVYIWDQIWFILLFN